MRWNGTAFKTQMQRILSPGTRDAGGLDPDLLKRLVREIVTTGPGEIGCDECFEQMDRFVDTVLAGKDAAAAMPLVQDHLTRCNECREEYEALLTALRTIS
jgi:hypothetical protein